MTRVEPTSPARERLTTSEFAARLRLKARTLHTAICRHGHYCQIRPVKLPNGRLLWPADAVERLLSGVAR